MTAQSTGCCFPEWTKLIAPFHPFPFPPAFAEGGLHGHRLQGSKCICIYTQQITPAMRYCPALLFQWDHNTHAVTDMAHTCLRKSCPAPSLSIHLDIPRPAFLRYSCSAGRDWYLMQGDCLSLQTPSSGSGQSFFVLCPFSKRGKHHLLLLQHTQSTSN